MNTEPQPKPVATAERPKRLSPREYICHLIGTFPCLRHRLRFTPESWDADDLGKMLGVLSTGERHAALFILCVWNPGYAKGEGWRFDALDAMGNWDSGNRKAFINWAQNPYWP